MKCIDSWGNRGSPLQEFTAAGNGEGRLYLMRSASDQKNAKIFWWPKNSLKTTFKNRARPPNYRMTVSLRQLYAKYGKAEDCRIELFDCGHEELPETGISAVFAAQRQYAGPNSNAAMRLKSAAPSSAATRRNSSGKSRPSDAGLRAPLQKSTAPAGTAPPPLRNSPAFSTARPGC